MNVEQPLQDAAAEAMRIYNAASEKGITLRLIGGTAFQFLCPTFREGSLHRVCHDVDVVGLAKQNRAVRELAASLGYGDDKRFNALHGHQRFLFFDNANKRDLDVFVDRLMQCHDLDFRKRLDIFEPTLPLADLLLSKLQVMHINIKDIRDSICLLQDFPIDNHDNSAINIDYITQQLGSDWGFWKTIILNLERVAQYLHEELDVNTFSKALENVTELQKVLEDCPKSLSWKLRDIVGERVKWYEEPEDRSEML